MTSNSFDREVQFHNKWARQMDLGSIEVDSYFESCTAPENRFILDRLGSVKDKYILDLGCGAGENSIYFAKQGASCVALDCSPAMLDNVLQLADRYNVQVETVIGEASNLPFSNELFDIVYASNLLHHMNSPEECILEMYRVVKRGGKVCFWDPLKHNPVINIYRNIATKVRSVDEVPLSIDIIKFLEDNFVLVEWDTFWIATLWIFLQFYFIERVNPNEERYWKKIIVEHDRLEGIYSKLERIDKILKRFPFLKRYAWNIAVVATK